MGRFLVEVRYFLGGHAHSTSEERNGPHGLSGGVGVVFTGDEHVDGAGVDVFVLLLFCGVRGKSGV